jgi:hypothetical protein
VYSKPIEQAFMAKVGKFAFRMSCYLDDIVEKYFSLGYQGSCSDPDAADRAVFHIKHNILLSLFASFSCLAQGLFLQSGILLRAATEDCLVLVDLFCHAGQIDRLLAGEYSGRGVLKRVKRFIPPCLVGWYGDFSANFAHFGPLHPAPYMPAACYPDNWVLVIGLQSVVRVLAALHIVLERVYFEQTEAPVLWARHGTAALEFNEESAVFSWAEMLSNDLVACYAPDEKKPGFTYGKRRYRLK